MTNNTLRVCSTCQVRKKFCLLLNLPLTPHPRSANDQCPMTISYLKSWTSPLVVIQSILMFLRLDRCWLTKDILTLFFCYLTSCSGWTWGRGLGRVGWWWPDHQVLICISGHWTLDIIINNPPCQDAPHRILTPPHLPFRVLEPSKSWRLLAENSVSRYESKHCQRRNRPRLLSLKLE